MTNSAYEFSDLLSCLENFEQDILVKEDVDYESVSARLNKAVERMPSNLSTQMHDETAIDYLHDVSERIRILVSTRLNLKEDSENIFSTMCAEVGQVLISTSRDNAKQTTPELSENIPSYQMRKHFLSLLDDPYPDQTEKELVVKTTNEHFANSSGPQKHNTLRLEQLGLWYINARRRSGWSQILAKFARNERKRMKALIQARMIEEHLPIKAPLPNNSKLDIDTLLQDNLGPAYTSSTRQDFEDEWGALISWIKYGVKDKVSNWIQDIVDESKKTNKRKPKPRAVSNAAKRTPGRRAAPVRQTRLSAASDASSTTTPDKAQSVWSASSTDDYTAFFSGSSADSMSSFDSSLPQKQDPASPTLKTTKGRQVKALPSRTQVSASSTRGGVQQQGHYPSILLPGARHHTEVSHGYSKDSQPSAFPGSAGNLYQSSLSAAFG